MRLAGYLQREVARRARIREIVAVSFELAAGERVRRDEVVQTVAKALGVRVVLREFRAVVRAVVEGMGPVDSIKPGNARFFLGLRRRADRAP